jgi:hypothetical protein
MSPMVVTITAMVTATRVVPGLLSVSGNAGMRLLTRRELFSPTG